MTAFDDLTGFPGEMAPWHEFYDFTDSIHVHGSPSPVQITRSGVGIVATGIGKPAAAATTAALVASDRFDFEETLFVTAGVAGGPPALDVGSVVVADTIVDWDHKFRVDATREADSIAMNTYTGGSAFRLNPNLVEWALGIAREVDLSAEDGRVSDDGLGPSVVAGTNLCGDELWHGRELARQADWLVEQHGMGPYRATEMEDAGTAVALDRFGFLDRYLSIRGISNRDRPAVDTAGLKSLRGSAFDAGFSWGIQNAAEVARAVVEHWIRSPPS